MRSLGLAIDVVIAATNFVVYWLEGWWPNLAGAIVFTLWAAYDFHKLRCL